MCVTLYSRLTASYLLWGGGRQKLPGGSSAWVGRTHKAGLNREETVSSLEAYIQVQRNQAEREQQQHSSWCCCTQQNETDSYGSKSFCEVTIWIGNSILNFSNYTAQPQESPGCCSWPITKSDQNIKSNMKHFFFTLEKSDQFRLYFYFSFSGKSFKLRSGGG